MRQIPQTDEQEQAVKCSVEFRGGCEIRFEGKPPEAVRNALKRHRFRWSPAGKCWHRRQTAGAADLVTWIREYGEPVETRYSKCWRCKGPEGLMRNRGAAAPAWCDDCLAAVEAGEEVHLPIPDCHADSGAT